MFDSNLNVPTKDEEEGKKERDRARKIFQLIPRSRFPSCSSIRPITSSPSQEASHLSLFTNIDMHLLVPT